MICGKCDKRTDDLYMTLNQNIEMIWCCKECWLLCMNEIVCEHSEQGYYIPYQGRFVCMTCLNALLDVAVTTAKQFNEQSLESE